MRCAPPASFMEAHIPTEATRASERRAVPAPSHPTGSVGEGRERGGTPQVRATATQGGARQPHPGHRPPAPTCRRGGPFLPTIPGSCLGRGGGSLRYLLLWRAAVKGAQTGGPRAPPWRLKLADESPRTPAFQFRPRPGLRRGSRCHRGRAAFHLPNVVAWGSTAKAAIAAAATLRSGPSRFSKNGGKPPAGRGALPYGVTPLPDMRRPAALGAGAVRPFGRGLGSAQTQCLPGAPGDGGSLRGNRGPGKAAARALGLLLFWLSFIDA